MENENKIVDTEAKETTNEGNKPESADASADLEAKYQALLVEQKRLKSAFDKASSDAANYKKQLRERQSVDEIALQEKAEKEAQREELLESLKRENKINKLEKQFVLLGYSEEQANKAATATYDGDTDTLFKVQSEVQNKLIEDQKAEWLKSRPEIQNGQGSKGEEDEFIKGFWGK